MKLSDENFSDLVQALKQAGTAVVITHEFPDGDAAGSIAGCCHLLKSAFPSLEVSVYCKTPVPENYDYLQIEKLPHADLSLRYDVVLVLDCGNPGRTGEKSLPDTGLSVNIDHHADNSMFGDLNYVYPQSSSTSEILAVLGRRLLGITLPDRISEALFTGILTDTGGFRFSSTTSFTHEIAAMLYQSSGVDFGSLIEKVYFEEPFAKQKLLARILTSMEQSCGICFSHISSADWEETGATSKMVEGLVNQMVGIQGIIVAVLFQELPGIVKVSFRSKGKVDCQVLAGRFGGGGHSQAAGAKIQGLLKDIEPQVLKFVRETVK
ncbi:MAG: bifunctional oligoribonuclease/PAP phosphatase NrnA [Candidatus Wallbacteria bacterium]|nr:bifunctional oligoribonuclease/PAP phosphatase NrnA [Candidatus Wallbacteria bacterium]